MARVEGATDGKIHLWHMRREQLAKTCVCGAYAGPYRPNMGHMRRKLAVVAVKSKIVCKLPAAPSYAASISSLCRLAMAASPAALLSSSITAGL